MQQQQAGFNQYPPSFVPTGMPMPPLPQAPGMIYPPTQQAMTTPIAAFQVNYPMMPMQSQPIYPPQAYPQNASFPAMPLNVHATPIQQQQQQPVCATQIQPQINAHQQPTHSVKVLPSVPISRVS
jgi:hypothetical protein